MHLGRTPMLVGALYRGRHTLTLAKSGWATQDIAFRVVPNSVSLQNHYLARVKSGNGRDGAVIIHAAAGTHVRLDGQAIPDPEKSRTITAGRHVVQVDQPAGGFSREFDVIPEMTTDVVLRDVPAARVPSVVAPVSSYLPSSAVTIEHTKVIVRFHNHIAVGHLGDQSMRFDTQTIRVDPAPIVLDNQLYLPVDTINLFNDPPPSH